MNFKIWKTITLGIYKSVKAYRKALIKAGFGISHRVSGILNKIRVSQSRVQLDLVNLSIAELGFNEITRRDKIYVRAKKRGLELCPAEVGLALRLACPDQSSGEWLVAMKPIPDSGSSDLWIFRVACIVTSIENARWLHVSSDDPDDLFDLDDRFIFVLPRK